MGDVQCVEPSDLGYPNPNFCLPPGPNGEVDSVRQAGCSFGRITNIQTDPRAMQFALKLYFWNVIGAGEGSGQKVMPSLSNSPWMWGTPGVGSHGSSVGSNPELRAER